MNPTSLLLTITLTTLLIWPAVLTLIGRIGGWSRLAKHYRAVETPEGRRYRFQSLRLGSGNYGNCVTIRVSDQGLYLALPWLFQFGHPSLLIPWSELNLAAPPTGWIKRFGTLGSVGLEVGSPPFAKLYLPKRIFEDLQKDRGLADASVDDTVSREV